MDVGEGVKVWVRGSEGVGETVTVCICEWISVVFCFYFIFIKWMDFISGEILN